MELDFSKLENIAYRGFEGAEARAEKDALIEQGFTVIEGATTPFDAPPAQEPYSPTPPPKSPLKRQLKPFTGMDKNRNYRAMYRAACDFHERHNPPTLEGDYWSETTDDMTETANRFDNDPFLTGLLVAIFEELEREYRALRDSVSQG